MKLEIDREKAINADLLAANRRSLTIREHLERLLDKEKQKNDMVCTWFWVRGQL
jgi:hypothetical protein